MLFKEIDKILSEKNNSLYKKMNKGHTRDEIIAKMNSIDISIPEDLIELYSWHNGIKIKDEALGELWLFPLAIFFCLEDAIKFYNDINNTNKYWKPKMFPVFGDGGGDFYLIDLDEHSQNYGQYFYYCLSDPFFDGIISIFDTTESALKTIYECYKQYVLFKEKALENLTFNDKKYFEIGEKINPKSDFWLQEYN